MLEFLGFDAFRLAGNAIRPAVNTGHASPSSATGITRFLCSLDENPDAEIENLHQCRSPFRMADDASPTCAFLGIATELADTFCHPIGGS